MSYGSLPLTVRRIDRDGVAILELTGKIMGSSDAERLRDAIEPILVEGRMKILLDFTAVPWMNSQGVGALMSLVTSLRSTGGRVKLVGVNERVRSVLDVTRLSAHFEFHASVGDALVSFLGASRPGSA